MRCTHKHAKGCPMDPMYEPRDVTGVFASQHEAGAKGSVLNWQGENYEPQRWKLRAAAHNALIPVREWIARRRTLGGHGA